MTQFIFEINGIPHAFTAEAPPTFRYGSKKVLSGPDTDITFYQSWYPEGFQAIPFLSQQAFDSLKYGLTHCIQTLIEKELELIPTSFRLEDYHKWVDTKDKHFKIVSKTRDLFPQDFNFPIKPIISRFEKELGFGLTDINPIDGKKLHIIVRINRPRSTDYNPPHKDIYQGIDGANSYIPQFVNIWIPICGVTDKSSLPLAAASHLIPESDILRTFEGGVLSGNTYRVRMVKSWAGKNQLKRAKVGYGEALFFSSHLIHGLAVNEEENTTRISLEFRLFKAK